MSAHAAKKPPVVVVAGPTAAGKTAVAIDLAERFDGEIVNADSMQVYRYLDIGTAKPTAEERARVPHHLVDIVTPDQVYDAGRYSRDARAAASAIAARGRAVFVVGGTGLYLRAFLEGLIDSGQADPQLRADLEAQADRAESDGEPERLHARLADLDPVAAGRIHPNDRRRTVRALEIALGTGVPASTMRDTHGFADRPFAALYLVIDPGVEALDARIDARAKAMIEGGLLQEARDLRERGYGPELRSMRAIGYRHMQPVVDGRDTLESALADMRRDTRRFARRQRTWFRAVEGARWTRPEDVPGLYDGVAAHLRDAGEPSASKAPDAIEVVDRDAS